MAVSILTPRSSKVFTSPVDPVKKGRIFLGVKICQFCRMKRNIKCNGIQENKSSTNWQVDWLWGKEPSSCPWNMTKSDVFCHLTSESWYCQTKRRISTVPGEEVNMECNISEITCWRGFSEGSYLWILEAVKWVHLRKTIEITFLYSVS